MDPRVLVKCKRLCTRAHNYTPSLPLVTSPMHDRKFNSGSTTQVGGSLELENVPKATVASVEIATWNTSMPSFNPQHWIDETNIVNQILTKTETIRWSWGFESPTIDSQDSCLLVLAARFIVWSLVRVCILLKSVELPNTALPLPHHQGVSRSHRLSYPAVDAPCLNSAQEGKRLLGFRANMYKRDGQSLTKPNESVNIPK